MQNELKIDKQIQVSIEHLGSRGEGVAHYEGNRIFVSKAAPGDVLLVELKEKLRGQWVGQKVELIRSSPKRISPPCSHFEDCGGCDFQHLDYADQVEWKKSITKHWLNRSPLAPHISSTVFDTLLPQESFGYRNRVRIQIKNGKPTFYKPRSREPLSIKECPVLEEGFFEALQKESQKKENAKDQIYTWASRALVSSKEEGSYKVGDHELSFEGSNFVQASWKMNEQMNKRIQEDLNDLSSKDLAWDLYCGVGNFSASLIQSFVGFVGVELSPSAIEQAQKNFPRAKWVAKKVEDFVTKKKAKPDFVLLDPPRSGALQTCRKLLALEPKRITYVSCQLDSLIRDLTQVVKKGPYQLERWTTVDLFPQTKHIESIVSLKLAD